MFTYLGLVSPVRSHNPDKIIINHSSYQLSDIEKTILAKGLNFALPSKKLNYADYLTPYELLFRDIKELSVDDSILERVKVDMKKICLSSFENFKFKPSIFELMSYSKVIVIFMVLIKNKLPRCFLELLRNRLFCLI